MYFEYLLDATMGPRVIFHVVECSICGFEEIYYTHPETGQFIGRACAECYNIQKFKSNNSKTTYKSCG